MVKIRRPCSRASSLSSPRTAICPAAVQKDIKEWDESRCPVCLDHPHNAVLLRCSCHEKGCRPYMCDTSYRHSNCLDQFRKVSNGDENRTLTCPLCRGVVEKWVVVSAAREYMDAKARSCSKEGCGFSGNYVELRNHARMEHPFVRPSDADPQRELEWRRMEQLRDIEDAIGSIRVQLNGADEVNLSDIVDDIHLSFWADANVTARLVIRLFGDGRASLMSMTTARPGVQTSQLRRRATTLPATSTAPLEGQSNRARQTRSPLPSENAIIVGDEPSDQRSQSSLASTDAVIVGDEPRGRRGRSPLPSASVVVVGDELSNGRRSSLSSVNAVIVEDEPSGRRRRRRQSPSRAEAPSVELLSVVDGVVFIEESNTDESDENAILQERGRRQRQRRMRTPDEDDIF